MKPIAYIENNYISKFGIPRQGGIINNEKSRLIFEKEYSLREAFRGLEEFNYIWLIWEFSLCKGKEWSPTVRPPRLGGNKRVGVFATRSPYRPNPIGLTSAKLEKIEFINSRAVLTLSGCDLMNGTPVYDIKPYLNYADIHNDSTNGFALTDKGEILQVNIPQDIADKLSENDLSVIKQLLAQDPRPQYQNDNRAYGLSFGRYNIKFTVKDNILNVTEIETE